MLTMGRGICLEATDIEPGDDSVVSTGRMELELRCLLREGGWERCCRRSSWGRFLRRRRTSHLFKHNLLVLKGMRMKRRRRGGRQTVTKTINNKNGMAF